MSEAAETARRNKAFETLGLPPGAGRDRIRRAFRRLALACHPDRHGGSPEMAREFQKIARAHRIAIEFAIGFVGETAPDAAEPDAAEHDTTRFAPPPGHLTASPPAPIPVRPLEYRLRLDFTQAALGGEVSLRYSRRTACPACRDEISNPCTRCAGAGHARETAVLGVHIPAGVAEGEILRLRGAGDAGPEGAPAGDLHIRISTRGHPAFRRRGLDIHSEVKLPEHRLEDGGPVRVPTVQGARRITIPPGTAPGATFRLRGMGVRRDDGERGDHIVRIGELKPEDYEPPKRPAGSKSRATAVRQQIR